MKRITRIKIQTFWVINIVFALVLVASIIFSIFDSIYCIINWPCSYSNVIGIVVQVITAVMACIVSFIGISITLQKDDYLGIEISTFYSLRKNQHYSCQQFTILSILLCAINIAFYMLSLNIASISATIISVILCVHIAYVEIPFMSRDKKAYNRLIKDNLMLN